MKTDKTKNWTDSWKEQLDEYSVTPPPEVWEELSKELAPRRISFWKRTIWWAAACITHDMLVGCCYRPFGVRKIFFGRETCHFGRGIRG